MSARGPAKELLPLSTPSPQSLSISIARSKAWLTLPPSRVHPDWGPPRDKQTRLHMSTPGFTGTSCTPYTKSVGIDVCGRSNGDSGVDVVRRASYASLGGKHLRRTSSAGTTVSTRLRSKFTKFNGRKSLLGGGNRLNMEPQAKVRQAVIKSLTTVGVPGNIDLLEVIAERLYDSDVQVQRQAVMALTVLIAPVVDGPIERNDDDVGDNGVKRISELMAVFRSQLLLLIEHRSNKCRSAALEGLKVVAKPGDYTCLKKLVANIHQIAHLDAVQLLRKIATPSSNAVVIDCLLYCIRTHDEKMCDDEKTSQAQLKWYVDYLKEVSVLVAHGITIDVTLVSEHANMSLLIFGCVRLCLCLSVCCAL